MELVPPVYAIIVVILMYFGIKVYVAKKRQSIQNEIGEGLCMECSSKLDDNKCPHCNSDSLSNIHK